MIRRELKEKFLLELMPSEKVFFLKRAREAITSEGYRPGEDLFWYCFYLTLHARLRGTGSQRAAYEKLLFVEGMKDVEDAVKMYEERLEKNRQPSPHPEGEKFMEYFSG